MPCASRRARSAASGAILPSIGDTVAMKLLPAVLAVVAGSTDVIGFLGLGGLFTAHITGNVVIFVAHIVAHGKAPVAQILSVPVFIGVLFLTRLLVAGLAALELRSLQPLLVLQALLLAGFLAARVAAGAHLDPDAAIAIAAGMFGVAAMAVQNALVHLSLAGTPATAVMTTNVTRFALAVGQIVAGRSPRDRSEARKAAKHTLPPIAGFAIGCGLGAACESAFGSWSLALPVTLAVLAIAMSLTSERRTSHAAASYLDSLT
jgi:uncharacterized membrane protein YoaK (UPF0700 family)